VNTNTHLLSVKTIQINAFGSHGEVSINEPSWSISNPPKFSAKADSTDSPLRGICAGKAFYCYFAVCSVYLLVHLK
jgi:hypothetical protein